MGFPACQGPELRGMRRSWAVSKLVKAGAKVDHGTSHDDHWWCPGPEGLGASTVSASDRGPRPPFLPGDLYQQLLGSQSSFPRWALVHHRQSVATPLSWGLLSVPKSYVVPRPPRRGAYGEGAAPERDPRGGSRPGDPGPHATPLPDTGDAPSLGSPVPVLAFRARTNGLHLCDSDAKTAGSRPPPADPRSPRRPSPGDPPSLPCRRSSSVPRARRRPPTHGFGVSSGSGSPSRGARSDLGSSGPGPVPR